MSMLIKNVEIKANDKSMSEIYRVISISHDTILVEADDFDADNDRVIFIKNNQNVAWFNSDNLVGFIKVQEHECG